MAPPRYARMVLWQQMWCRGKKKWESEILCLDCHSFTLRTYADPDFKTPEEYEKERWQVRREVDVGVWPAADLGFVGGFKARSMGNDGEGVVVPEVVLTPHRQGMASWWGHSCLGS